MPYSGCYFLEHKLMSWQLIVDASFTINFGLYEETELLDVCFIGWFSFLDCCAGRVWLGCLFYFFIFFISKIINNYR